MGIHVDMVFYKNIQIFSSPFLWTLIQKIYWIDNITQFDGEERKLHNFPQVDLFFSCYSVMIRYKK